VSGAAHGWVKVCGLTTAEAVSAALEAGVDAIGFVFAESVRRVEPEQARRLAEPARGRARCVAVTRHPDPALLERIEREFAPDVLQSDVEDFARLPSTVRAQALPVLRAGRSLPEPLPPRLLFEGPVSGTGRIGDWDEAARLATRTELILAGGLRPGNVGVAIRRVRPYGVDVSSGVEVAPGLKSPQKIHDFVKEARATFQELIA
jgi:phosphoribosylanthranilate isomerase